jgi:hypothetical protein
VLGFSDRPKVCFAGEFDVSGHIVISYRFKSVAMTKTSSRASPVSVSIQEASDERRERKENRRVAMRGPDSVEGDQALGVRRPTEDVTWHENPLVPKRCLVLLRGIGDALSFASSLEPIPVRVVFVLEPSIDKEIRPICDTIRDIICECPTLVVLA